MADTDELEKFRTLYALLQKDQATFKDQALAAIAGLTLRIAKLEGSGPASGTSRLASEKQSADLRTI